MMSLLSTSLFKYFKSLKWSYVAWTLSWNSAHGSGLEVLMGICLSLSSCWAHFCLSWRHSLMESRISWQTLSSISASEGFLPGNLHSWYTSLYTPLISSWVNLGPMTWTADDSTPRSCSGEACHWPQWMAWSCSFLPVAITCKNILYRMNGWWNQHGSHRGYSSRKASALSHLSTSHMEMPVSYANFLVAAVFAVWFSYLKLIKML